MKDMERFGLVHGGDVKIWWYDFSVLSIVCFINLGSWKRDMDLE